MFLLSLYSDWALAFLRIVLGLLFVFHGWPKIKNLRATAENFSNMGFRPGVFWGPLVAGVEFFGGLALILGIWTPIVAALLTVQFLVIIVWKIWRGEWSFSNLELDLLILAVALLLLTMGAGALSLDSLFSGGF